MAASVNLKVNGILCLVAVTISSLPARAETPVVHAVIVGDTSPAAGWGRHAVNITMDTTRMFAALAAGLPQSQCQVYPLTLEDDETSSPENVTEYLKTISAGANDTLLFYFSGHGAADDRGHYFQLAKGRLYRDDLRRLMQQKGVRLSVLLSDCCNVRGDGFAFFAPAIDDRSPAHPTPLFESLFLKPSGWVDLNASSPGEAAFFRNPPPGVDPFSDPSYMPGSLFTTALTGLLNKRSERTLEWSQLIRELSVDVHIAFRSNYPQGAVPSKGQTVQSAQHVYAIEYPGMPEKSGPRTGLTVRDHPGQGVLIVDVPAGSPGRQAYSVADRKFVALRPGQVVLTANGVAVAAASDLVDAVHKSPQLMRLEIQASARTKPREYLLTLRY